MNLNTVALLLDVESLGAYPNLIRESTGEPMTAEEVAAVGTAGWDEIRAMRDYHALAAEAAQETADALARAMELMRKYGFDSDRDILGGELEARMSPEDHAEVQAALQRIATVES